MTPIERRAGQPVPETVEQAQERFRCDGLLATISGRQCGMMHSQARKTGDSLHLHVCVNCPAGMARAALLDIGEPLCSALVLGNPCGLPGAHGSRFCQKHRSAGAHMHQRLGQRPVFAAGGAIERRERAQRPQLMQPRACPQCEYVHTPRASTPESVRDWCIGCRTRAKEMLQRRNRACDVESIARILASKAARSELLGEQTEARKRLIAERQATEARKRLIAERQATKAAKRRREYGRVTCRRCQREFVAGHGQEPTPGLEPWCKICRRSATNYVNHHNDCEERAAAIVRWLTETDDERRARERAAPRARCISCDYPLLRRRGKSAGVLCFGCAQPVIRYLHRRGIEPTPETIEARMRARMRNPEWVPPAFAVRRAEAAKLEAAS
jgi:hypothetical protein